MFSDISMNPWEVISTEIMNKHISVRFDEVLTDFEKKKRLKDRARMMREEAL